MEVVASAPGKVLIAGGYLVMERPNAGIVLSTTARFYAIVTPMRQEIRPDSWAWKWTDVRVTSPQLGREVTYKLSLKNWTLQCTSSRDSTNPFVEQAIQYAMAASSVISKDSGDALNKLLLQGLDITILGCNDFYSYRSQIEDRGLPLTPKTLASLPPFSSITFNTEDNNRMSTGEKCKPEVAKTGLGSSAAMTTSVVAALLQYLGAVNLPFSDKNVYEEKTNEADLNLVHVISQTAHCLAQGKIGSGFDVSAAVYGSQHYVRFSPAVLSSAQVIGGKQLPDAMTEILKEKWDHETSKFSLPPLMTLLLGEPGTGGSSTPSMVGAVKQWQKSDPKNSLETWRRLASANSMLEEELKKLSRFAEDHWEAYRHIVSICSAHAHGKWMEQASNQCQESIVKSLLGARNAFIDIRFHMQQVGKAAGIPIEPELQTHLLDTTMDMEGVLVAGIPGAGGYDAVFAIILGEAINNVIDTWSSLGVLPLLVREDPRGLALESGDPRIREMQLQSNWIVEDPRGVALESGDPRIIEVSSSGSSIQIS